MNENINLCEILKDCPKGTKLYTSLVGEVTFCEIKENKDFPIQIEFHRGSITGTLWLTKEGKYFNPSDGECLLFPSKNQRDWSKFKAPWLKKPKFDPKTLKPFDKVLAYHTFRDYWVCDLFSNWKNEICIVISGYIHKRVIPYNEDTKHLVGTCDEAPEYYRYWKE